MINSSLLRSTVIYNMVIDLMEKNDENEIEDRFAKCGRIRSETEGADYGWHPR